VNYSVGSRQVVVLVLGSEKECVSDEIPSDEYGELLTVNDFIISLTCSLPSPYFLSLFFFCN
jgi:hypothetical protein